MQLDSKHFGEVQHLNKNIKSMCRFNFTNYKEILIGIEKEQLFVSRKQCNSFIFDLEKGFEGCHTLVRS